MRVRFLLASKALRAVAASTGVALAMSPGAMLVAMQANPQAPRFVYAAGPQGVRYYASPGPQAAAQPRTQAAAARPRSVGPGTRDWTTGQKLGSHKPWLRSR